MQRATVIEQLKQYIGRDVLGGKDIGLDDTTPLLEWGIINSLEIVRLLSFIRQEFSIDISMEKLVPEHFVSISAIADLVLEQTPR
jgi:acyl carrier protein